jgi:hypothetical protein
MAVRLRRASRKRAPRALSAPCSTAGSEDGEEDKEDEDDDAEDEEPVTSDVSGAPRSMNRPSDGFVGQFPSNGAGARKSGRRSSGLLLMFLPPPPLLRKDDDNRFRCSGSAATGSSSVPRSCSPCDPPPRLAPLPLIPPRTTRRKTLNIGVGIIASMRKTTSRTS